MQTSTYLFLDGTCEEAFERYRQILGGRITAMYRHAGTPAAEQVPPEWQDKIMHACLDLGDRQLMGSDACGRFQPLQGFSIQVAATSANDAERIFTALAEGGNVTVPLEQTFWAERFGMLVDRFGVPWMVNYDGQVSSAGPETAGTAGVRQ
jgi:PhnB protein